MVVPCKTAFLYNRSIATVSVSSSVGVQIMKESRKVLDLYSGQSVADAGGSNGFS